MDTPNPDNTPAPATDPAPNDNELGALRAHNAKLLAELKDAKRKAGELTAQVEAITGERDSAVAAVERMTLEPTVNAALKDIMAMPPHMVRPLLEHQYGLTFGLYEGKPVMRKDGEIVTNDDGFIEVTAASLRAYFIGATKDTPDFNNILRGSGASGAGAPPNRFGVYVPERERAKPPAPAAAQPFGIR